MWWVNVPQFIERLYCEWAWGLFPVWAVTALHMFLVELLRPQAKSVFNFNAPIGDIPTTSVQSHC